MSICRKITIIFFEVDAAGEFEAEAEILAEALDQSAEYKVSAYASALENTVELGSYVENEVDDGLFDDVKDPKHPYFTAIYWAVDKGITKGYTGTNLFGIDDPYTRGQAMMFLWRMAGKPNPTYKAQSPFKDTITPAYKTAVLWAVEKKVTNGFSDGTFRDKAECTRGMIVKFLYNIR